MSGGKSNNQSSTDPRLTGAQATQVEAQNKFFTDTLAPTYTGAVRGATDVYNQAAGGVLNAAQNQAGVARQAQGTLGETGESALRTGISGLESLFNPDYLPITATQSDLLKCSFFTKYLHLFLLC